MSDELQLDFGHKVADEAKYADPDYEGKNASTMENKGGFTILKGFTVITGNHYNCILVQFKSF